VSLTAINMDNFFTQSLKDHTILWLFLTSIVGGIIGAAIKLFSENILSQNIILNRQARSHFEDYSFKLLKAAKSLDRRLDFIINDKKIFAYEEMNSRLSFYYALGNYLGWCKIIQEDAIDKFRRLPKTVKKFNIAFLQTLKGLSSNYYFKDCASIEEIISSGAVIPNYCHTAISDLMLSNLESNKTIIKSPILSFSDFCLNYEANESTRNWFVYFDKLLQNMEFKDENLNWNRLLIISMNLKVLIYQIDKPNRYTPPYKNLPHLKYFDKQVLTKMQEDIQFLKGHKISIPKAFKYSS
jgi:hypothetical protein